MNRENNIKFETKNVRKHISLYSYKKNIYTIYNRSIHRSVAMNRENISFRTDNLRKCISLYFYNTEKNVTIQYIIDLFIDL